MPMSCTELVIKKLILFFYGASKSINNEAPHFIRDGFYITKYLRVERLTLIISFIIHQRTGCLEILF